MLDPKILRNDLEETARKVGRRGYQIDIEKVRSLEEERKTIQVQTQDLQNKRKVISKNIGIAKKSGEDATPFMEEVAQIGKELDNVKSRLDEIQAELTTIHMDIPNIPDDEIPDGTSEDDNREIRKWGEPKELGFTPKDHVDICIEKGWMDFDAGAKLAGSRFVVMHNQIARMHRALIQLMLDTHSEEHGYAEINVPYLVNSDSMRGTGQLPKFEEDLFKTNDERGLYLIPTAEVPVTNLVRDEIISAENLPLKFACHTPCFRAEAGSAGKDVRGIIRQHQFEKVELVNVVKPEDSDQALEDLTACAEKILQKLELPYRVVELCTGDIGFSAAKTYDIEVWLPGQGRYREISSCSNFRDFQARRMQARWRNPETEKPELVHTLNGSGLAVGRCLVAVLENYQQEDGSIIVPKALQKYMNAESFS